MLKTAHDTDLRRIALVADQVGISKPTLYRAAGAVADHAAPAGRDGPCQHGRGSGLDCDWRESGTE